jgi:hypothetical protein
MKMFDAILDFLIYAVFPYFSKKKRRNEEWYGVVEEKREEGDFSLRKHTHAVIFRTGEGHKRKLKMTEEQFNRYEKGKQYHKRKGEDYPDPVS